MRELYGRFGRRHDLLHGLRLLLPPEELEADGSAPIRQTEKFWLYQIAVPIDRIAETDPPVLIDGSSQAYDDWEPFADRFSAVCVETVMSENSLCGDRGGWHRERLAPYATYLEQSLTPIPPLIFPGGQENANRWYAGADVLVREDRSDRESELGWLYVRALTREALDGFRAALPGQWTETVDHLRPASCAGLPARRSRQQPGSVTREGHSPALLMWRGIRGHDYALSSNLG